MLAFFVTFLARVVISPVIPLITDDFGVSNTQIGFALTGMWLAYGLTQFPSGVLADRFGEKRVILVAVGGTTVMTALIAFTSFFPLFVVCVVLLGAVAGLHYSVATTFVSRMYDDIGRAIGVHSTGGPLAGLLGPVVAAWLGVQFGWRPAIGFAVVLGIPVFVLFGWRVRPTDPRRPEQPMRTRFEFGTLGDILSRPPVAFTLLVGMLGTFAAQGLLSFLPTFLVEHRSLSATVAGAFFSAFFVVRGGAQVALGSVSDRYGRDVAIAGCMVGGVVGLALLVVGPGVAAVTAGVLLAAVGSSFFSALDSRFLDFLSDRERGAGFGLVRTAYTVVGSGGSVGVGLFADVFDWGVSFAMLTVLFLVTFCLLAVNEVLDLGY